MQQFSFHEYELLDGIVYNPTKLASLIKVYLKTKRWSKSPGLVIFSDQLVEAKLLSKLGNFSDLSTHMHVKSSLNDNWHYIATLKPGLLLQYQLLFRQIGIYIELFTCEMILHIQYTQDQADHNLVIIDSLEQLQAIIPRDLDLYHRVGRVIGKI